MGDSRSRFSDRAEDYAKYRPGYPEEILTFLRRKDALMEDSVVADVGSGTGILSAMLLEEASEVLAVEPNAEMRGAAERSLRIHSRFTSVAGSGEDTSLPGLSVDLITVANALHWLNPDKARSEFKRVLKPEGRLAVIWNVALDRGTPFLEALAGLQAKYRTDRQTASNTDEVYSLTESFFGERRGYSAADFPSSRYLRFEELRGLILSSSSLPAGDQPGADEMLDGLEELFRANESGGTVEMKYIARIYLGNLT